MVPNVFRKRFPGKVPKRFQARFPGTGRAPRKFPGKVTRNRLQGLGSQEVPSKVPRNRQGSQEDVPKQGSQEEVPKQSSQE